MNLRLERHADVAHLVIDRAAKRNAFTLEMWHALPSLLNKAMADPQVKSVILRSAQAGVFCAGADIAESAAHIQDAQWRAANHAAIAAAQHQLARAPKPVIAAIDGDCVGGGCGLAIACDIRIASPRSRLGITPARLGLVYSLHDTKLLVDLVGPSQAKRILFTAQLLSAEEAARIGLVDMMADDVLAEAAALAHQMASCSQHSIGNSKTIIRAILDGQSDDDAHSSALFADAFVGPDYPEGVAAFLEKRPAKFH